MPLVQFEKREKHLWKSVTFSEVADFRLQMVLNRAKPLILEWFAVNFDFKTRFFPGDFDLYRNLELQW